MVEDERTWKRHALACQSTAAEVYRRYSLRLIWTECVYKTHPGVEPWLWAPAVRHTTCMRDGCTEYILVSTRKSHYQHRHTVLCTLCRLRCTCESLRRDSIVRVWTNSLWEGGAANSQSERAHTGEPTTPEGRITHVQRMADDIWTGLTVVCWPRPEGATALAD